MKSPECRRHQLLCLCLSLLCFLAGCGDDPAPELGRLSDAGDLGRDADLADAADSSNSTADAGTRTDSGSKILDDAGAGPAVDAASDDADDAGLEDIDGTCSAMSQLVSNSLLPADIIIGVDTSASMYEEISFVRANLNAFSKQLDDSGIDAHVILIATAGDPDAMPDLSMCTTMPWLPACFSTDLSMCIDAPLGSGMCPADSNLPAYAHVDQAIGSTDMLGVFIAAYADYKPHLRHDSTKTFVAISDDDVDAVPDSASTFLAAVDDLEPSDPSMWADWNYSGIFCATACPAAAKIGAVHDSLVTQTGGVKGDLCLQDFEPVFDALAASVVEAAALACEWEIPTPPTGTSFDAATTNLKLTLDGQAELLGKVADAASCSTHDGWHYDDDATPTKLRVCPTTCTRMRAAKKVRANALFGCKSVAVAGK